MHMYKKRWSLCKFAANPSILLLLPCPAGPCYHSILDWSTRYSTSSSLPRPARAQSMPTRPSCVGQAALNQPPWQVGQQPQHLFKFQSIYVSLRHAQPKFPKQCHLLQGPSTQASHSHPHPITPQGLDPPGPPPMPLPLRLTSPPPRARVQRVIRDKTVQITIGSDCSNGNGDDSNGELVREV